MKHILLTISAAAIALTVGTAAATAEPQAPSEAQVKEISASLLTVFPIGVENVGYAKYFTGQTFLASPAAAGTRSGARNRRESFPERPRRFRKTSNTGTARSMAAGSSILPSCRRVREQPGWNRRILLNTQSSSDLRNAKKVKKRPEASSGIREWRDSGWERESAVDRNRRAFSGRAGITSGP